MMRYIDDDRASGKPFLASINFLANHIPVQAPDAGEIEWAGALVKKAPGSPDPQ